MRRAVNFIALSSLAALTLACQPRENGSIEARSVSHYTIEDFLGNTSFRGASFSPDNSKILVSSDETGVFNAFAIPADGSEALQLTNSTSNAILVHSYFPADERFLYSSDQGGNELTHIYVHNPNRADLDLTPGDSAKANFLGWAHDDGSFFISTNERDSRYFDIYEVTVDGFRREMLYQDESGYDFADMSADKRYIAFEKNVTRTDSDIYVYDRDAGEMVHLTPHEGEVVNSPETFSPDGRSLLFLSDEGSEFRRLVRQDLATGEREVIDRPGWDIRDAHFSKGGRYLVVAINADARTKLRVYDTLTMTPIELPNLPLGDITSVRFSSDEIWMAFYMSSARLPGDLFVYNLSSGHVKQLTRSLNEKINPAHLVDGEVVRFASYDGIEIPGIIYKPHEASVTEKAPALVWVHGGPGGQSRIGYRGLIQYLVNHGYAIYAINNRGSSGYGKTFFSMDDRKHGDADLDDVVASKEMLIETGYVDPNRIGIIGGSYGGYMVLAALAFRPEEFEVGVDIFGVANWVRTLQSIPPWWESIRLGLYKELGDPAVDADYLRRISPLFHAKNIVKPLIVLQGANDPRVLQIESDEMVEAVRANGVPVEYIVFDDEGHGFRKKENQLRGYQAILDFLDQHLKPRTEQITRASR